MAKSKYDVLWEKDRDTMGWKLPTPACWLLRLPVIRNFRSVFLGIRVDRHYRQGIGSIGLRSGYDEWVLYAIARGWC